MARVVDKASQEEAEGLSTAERVRKPLHMKLVRFIDNILKTCVSKSFKEKYEYP